MTETKKFVSLEFNSETKTNIMNYCLKNGLDVLAKHDGVSRLEKPEDQDFHITVMYSNNTPNKPLPIKDYELPEFTVKPTSFDIFGPNKDTLVLKIEVNNIMELLRTLFVDGYGLESTYPEWNPHLSLSYKHTEMPTFELPKFPIVVNLLKVEDQE